ncbi:hypothetical protein KDA11_00765 [Candidatus Saccharibacteria bacterium]|nr:hypothetical protein [Candidatus Saccharibacteria bacterium]
MSDLNPSSDNGSSSTIIWIIVAIIVIIIVLGIIGLIIWLIVRNNNSGGTQVNGTLCTSDNQCQSQNCAVNASGVGLDTTKSYCQPAGVNNSGTVNAVCTTRLLTSNTIQALCGNSTICDPQTNRCVARIVPIPVQQNAQSLLFTPNTSYTCYRVSGTGSSSVYQASNNNKNVGWMVVNLTNSPVSMYQLAVCPCAGSAPNLTCPSGINRVAVNGSIPGPGHSIWTDTLDTSKMAYRLPQTEGSIEFIYCSNGTNVDTDYQIDLTDLDTCSATGNCIVKGPSSNLSSSLQVASQWYLFIVVVIKGQYIVIRRAMGISSIDLQTVDTFVRIAQTLLA